LKRLIKRKISTLHEAEHTTRENIKPVWRLNFKIYIDIRKLISISDVISEQEVIPPQSIAVLLLFVDSKESFVSATNEYQDQ
jgi:hypothetical protein